MRIITVTLALFLASSALAASDSIKVVAVVNDQVISSVDLDERANLILATTGIPDTLETRTKLIPQILHQLVDEKLQIQDATASNITVGDEQVHEAIAKIEQQGNRPPGSLEQYLESKRVSKTSFFSQVRAQVAWSEIVLKKVRPKIHISDQEVARYVKQKTSSDNKPQEVKEVMIAVIQLPVDSPKNEASVHKVAEKLYEEIHSGASFEAVASQFSSGGSTRSAEPFWVEISQLDPAINAALAKIEKGGIADPVKTENGYQLVKLVDIRRKAAVGAVEKRPSLPNTELAFKQIIISAKPSAKNKAPEALLKVAKDVANAPGKCMEKTVDAKGLKNVDVNVSFIRRDSHSLPEKLHEILASLKIGAVSEPVATPEGLRLFMLCERVELPPETPSENADKPSDETIKQTIYTEKLELEAQKYMRNLRREAFIEVRGL